MFDWSYRFLAPLIHFVDLKKKPMYQLTKMTGSPAVYVYSSQWDEYWPISDGTKITGGDLLKVMSGTYANANIITVDNIPQEKITGNVKQN